MNEREQFQQDAIRAVTNAWLGAVTFEAAPDMQSIKPAKLASYKSSAKRVLASDAYQGECQRILEMAKNKIALQASNETEVAYWRGVCQGIKLLNESLLGFSQTVT